jgi:Domain of unknown function (DUF4277)/Transposase DDE domain
MALTWHGPAAAADVINVGPLALIHPLLDRLGVAAVIDQHLPPDPQLEYSHGRVLSLLLAARLDRPTALMNVADWADESGASLLWGIPADKLNDDRLGRALDAFFDHRHSVMAGVTARALAWADLGLDRIHFDTTHVTFYGGYESSRPRPAAGAGFIGDDTLAPAHITHGYLTDARMIQVGVAAVVDHLGAVPVLAHCLDGNRNGHTAVADQFALLRHHLPLPAGLLMVSDRGTLSADHLARLHRHGSHVLCAAPWNDYRAAYDAHEHTLVWREATFRSREQHRRRDTGSTLPREHYDLAVRPHGWTDPQTTAAIPGRLIFVRSTAAAAEERDRRGRNIDRIRAGLERLAAKLLRGHPCSTPASIQRQIARLMGHRSAAAFFHWELPALTDAEQAALPRPRKGFKRPSHRLAWRLDEAAALAAARYDGLSVLATTAPLTDSADGLFTKYKEQNYVERLHHQWKTPLAVRPVFLKSPRRVEALVCLLQIALQAHQVLERIYRQRVAATEPAAVRRTTAETLLRRFRVCGLLVRQEPIGRVACAVRPNARQREVLSRLGFPTVAQTLAAALPAVPTG